MSDRAEPLAPLFDAVPEERDAEVAPSEGQVPPYLRGTWYAIGPARFSRGGLAYRHWLDGDGMVYALAFGPDGVRFRARFVRTARRVAEEQAGRALYRAFGTAFSGDQLLRGVALASPANVSVMRFGGKLLAFGEQGLPWALDPGSLATLGEERLGGLNALAPLGAHPKVDPVTGELHTFGVSYAADRPALHYYRVGPDGALRLRRRIELDRPCTLHDFALGPRHAAFHLQPYLFDMAVLARGGSVLDALSFHPELGAKLLVLARDSGDPVCAPAVAAPACLHLVNAFDDGALLTVELIELAEPAYPDYGPLPRLFERVSPATLARLTIDLARGELVGRATSGPSGLAIDFPAIDRRFAGRRQRDTWLLAIANTGRPGAKLFDRLVHVDWAGESRFHQAPPGRYLAAEPTFVADPASPRGGAVICHELDPLGRAAWALVFDALDVAAGPIARLPLPGLIPPAFHTAFV